MTEQGASTVHSSARVCLCRNLNSAHGQSCTRMHEPIHATSRMTFNYSMPFLEARPIARFNTTTSPPWPSQLELPPGAAGHFRFVRRLSAPASRRRTHVVLPLEPAVLEVDGMAAALLALLGWGTAARSKFILPAIPRPSSARSWWLLQCVRVPECCWRSGASFPRDPIRRGVERPLPKMRTVGALWPYAAPPCTIAPALVGSRRLHSRPTLSCDATAVKADVTLALRTRAH